MGMGMKRREFLAFLGGAAAWPTQVRAQQPMPVIGFLHAASADGYASEAAAFRRGLHEGGYNEGDNVKIEYRWAEGHYERLPDLAADLVRRQVAVIATGADPAAVAAKAATDAIPIVFVLGVDPVRLGLVASLNRPERNITGIVNLSAQLVPKRIEIIHQVVQHADTIAVLLNPDNPNFQPEIDDLAATQKQLGVKIEMLKARTMADIEQAFAKVIELRAAALVIGAEPFFNSLRLEMASLAVRYGVPTIHELREFATAGGLMSYGADLPDTYRLAGVYVARILKGEKPTELPVQQSAKVQMTINLKAAKTLGLTFPLTVLGRADEAIE
jgi:putative tryptophan/tyrosine transport system substrate-binding protein